MKFAFCAIMILLLCGPTFADSESPSVPDCEQPHDSVCTISDDMHPTGMSAEYLYELPGPTMQPWEYVARLLGLMLLRS